MGILYLVATPIGNMEDITLRAIKTLGSVDFLLCEDTRHTGLLLSWTMKKREAGNWKLDNFFLKRPKLLSYQEYNELQRIPEVISLLIEGKNVALVSDSGTPTISDPGFKLVRECVRLNIPIISIPGPSAITSALIVSGFPTDKFIFLGYLPKKKGEKIKILNQAKILNNILKQTFICFETPHRLLETLIDIKSTLGNINVVVCREMTKLHEEFFRGTVEETIAHFASKSIKGEVTLLLRLS